MHVVGARVFAVEIVSDADDYRYAGSQGLSVELKPYELTPTVAEAACRLVTALGGEIVECCFVIELPELGGRERLEQQGYRVHALVAFDGH